VVEPVTFTRQGLFFGVIVREKAEGFVCLVVKLTGELNAVNVDEVGVILMVFCVLPQAQMVKKAIKKREIFICIVSTSAEIINIVTILNPKI
jgi:hypothetical protein